MDSESYLLTEMAFIDTAAKTLDVLDLPEGVSYTWRDVARGADDEVLLLSSDGSLYTYDPVSRAQTAAHPVIAPWQGPAEWQDAHPALVVNDGIAYVTEPATKKVFAVSPSTGEVLATATLKVAPNEIAVASGESA